MSVANSMVSSSTPKLRELTRRSAAATPHPSCFGRSRDCDRSPQARCVSRWRTRPRGLDRRDQLNGGGSDRREVAWAKGVTLVDRHKGVGELVPFRARLRISQRCRRGYCESYTARRLVGHVGRFDRPDVFVRNHRIGLGGGLIGGVGARDECARAGIGAGTKCLNTSTRSVEPVAIARPRWRRAVWLRPVGGLQHVSGLASLGRGMCIVPLDRLSTLMLYFSY